MTLNIVLLNRSGVHVAADFRLIALGNRVVLSDHSPKLLTLNEPAWSGVVSYCGVGSVNKIETSLWLQGWLKHETTLERSFAETAEIIRLEGNKLLAFIFQKTGSMRHSFVLAGFDRGRPVLALISNYDRIKEKKARGLHTGLFVEIRPISGTTLLITGSGSVAVPEEARRLLKSMAQNEDDPDVIRRTMARVIRHAADARESRESVSRSCFAYSLLPYGRADGRFFGDTTGRLEVISLEKGVNWMEGFRLESVPGEQLQLTGMTRAQFGRRNIAQPEPCHPEVLRPEGNSHMELHELPSLGGAFALAVAISNGGEAVGTSWGLGRHMPWRGTKNKDLVLSALSGAGLAMQKGLMI